VAVDCCADERSGRTALVSGLIEFLDDVNQPSGSSAVHGPDGERPEWLVHLEHALELVVHGGVDGRGHEVLADELRDVRDVLEWRWQRVVREQQRRRQRSHRLKVILASRRRFPE